MTKLAIITTHPIQYYAPLFRLLGKRDLQVKVFYTWGNVGEKKFDPGFGKEVSWDIPLTEGYDFTFVKNTAKNPGSHHFKGVENPSLIEEVQQWGATAILVFGWSYQSHFKAIRYFKGKIPVYFRGDSTLLDEVKGYKIILRRLFLRFVYSYVDFCFYVGQNNKAYFLKHGLKEKQLIFAPHAIDNSRFANFSDDASVQQKKEELGINDTDKVILFIGKFEPKKDPLLLLSAFKSISLENTHLIFIGNGVLESDLREKAGTNPYVHFLPFQNQSVMPAIYRLGDVVCLPSKGPGETWGLVMNEAMACGIPVIASDKCGGAIDLVEAGKTGFMFKAGNKDSLKEATLAFYHAKRSVNFKENCIAKIKDWDVAVTAEKIIVHLSSQRF